MALINYELVGIGQEIVDSCELENLRSEIARLKEENRILIEQLRERKPLPIPPDITTRPPWLKNNV